MGRPSNAELAARAAAAEAEKPDAEVTLVEADDDAGMGRPLEPFELPVKKVKADAIAPDGKVKCRISHKGDGKVATGHFDNQTNAFTYYKKGEFLMLHPSIADTQQENGYLEIVDGED